MRYCHFLVMKTAQELCAAFYEECCRASDVFYRMYPKDKPFIASYWGKFVPAARKHMAEILANPSFPDTAKKQIFDALTHDNLVEHKTGTAIN